MSDTMVLGGGCRSSNTANGQEEYSMVFADRFAPISSIRTKSRCGMCRTMILVCAFRGRESECRMEVSFGDAMNALNLTMRQSNVLEVWYV